MPRRRQLIIATAAMVLLVAAIVQYGNTFLIRFESSAPSRSIGTVARGRLEHGDPGGGRSAGGGAHGTLVGSARAIITDACESWPLSSRCSSRCFLPPPPGRQTRPPPPSSGHYVDMLSLGGSCSDSRSANETKSASTPWCSLARAAEAAPDSA